MQIVVDGYKIEYNIIGNGEDTLIILQGWGTSYELYNVVADSVSSKYKVIMFNLPGFGKSDEPKQPWAVDDFTDFFLKFVNELGIKKASVFGHSYGGRMLIKLLAREQSDLEIDKVVLCDSAGVLPKKTLKQKINIAKYKVIKSVVNIDFVYKICPELIDAWRSRQGSADYKNATPMMRACLVKAVNEDLTSLFCKNEKETLLIWGDNDTATPLSDGKKMEALMPNAGLAVIPGTGHFSFVENQAVFKSIMKAFFNI